MTPAKNKTIYVSLRTWGRFFWPFVDVEGGLLPVRAESVINNNSSQTSRTSESIFLPGESTSPVRLEVLRVLGLRPFILHNCDWLENSKPICKHRSSNAAALHDHNCFEICYLHILVDDLQYHMKCRISLVTSMQVPQDHIELPWPRFLIWKIPTCTIQSAPPLKLFAPKQQRYCILMVNVVFICKSAFVQLSTQKNIAKRHVMWQMSSRICGHHVSFTCFLSARITTYFSPILQKYT